MGLLEDLRGGCARACFRGAQQPTRIYTHEEREENGSHHRIAAVDDYALFFPISIPRPFFALYSALAAATFSFCGVERERETRREKAAAEAHRDGGEGIP